MNGLIQLTDAQFSNTDGLVLRCSLQGITFVLFKTNKCEYCKAAIPVLEHLAKHDLRLTWAMIDVSSYKNVIAMAKESSTPIRGVPTFILYVNNRPHINYKGKRTAESISEFINKALSSIGTQTARFVPQVPSGPKIPPPQRGGADAYPQNPQQQHPSKFPKSAAPRSRSPPERGSAKGDPNGFVLSSKMTPHNTPYLAYSQYDQGA